MATCKYCGYAGTNDQMADHAGDECQNLRWKVVQIHPSGRESVVEYELSREEAIKTLNHYKRVYSSCRFDIRSVYIDPQP